MSKPRDFVLDGRGASFIGSYTSSKQATDVRTRLGIILTLKLHQASLSLPFVGFDDDLCSRLLCRNPTEYWNCVL